MACAACNLLRRKCTKECIFVPYFPPKDREKFKKFVSLHRVFGESNLRNIIKSLPPDQRQDSINALIFEAEALIRDPVHGSVGLISFLYLYHIKLQQDFAIAKEVLAADMRLGAGVIPPLMIREANLSQEHFLASEAQRMGAKSGYQHGMSNGYEMEWVTATGFNQMDQGASGSRSNRGWTVFDQDFVASEAQRMAANRGGYQHGMSNGYEIVNNGLVTATGFNQMDGNDQGASGSRSKRGRPVSDQDFVAAMTQQDWSVTAKGFSLTDANEQGATSGSMSRPSLAFGSFSDSYHIGQDIEQYHIDHDQLQRPTHVPAYITRRSRANEGKKVSDQDYVGLTSGPFLPLGSFGDPCHINRDQLQSPDNVLMIEQFLMQ